MAGAGKPNYARRILVVNPGFQWKHAMTISLLVLVISSVMSAVLYETLHQQAILESQAGDTQSSRMTFTFFLSGIAFAVLTTGGVMFWCLVTSHRICGPIFVLTRALRELADGRIPTLRPLRKKDEFKEVYLLLIDVVDSLKARRVAEMEALCEALALLEQAALWDEPLRERAEALTLRIEALRDQDAAPPRQHPATAGV